MNNMVHTLQNACKRGCIKEICRDDLNRKVFQPADTGSASANETTDTEAKAEELFNSVTAYEAGASGNCDCRNRKDPSLTLLADWSILKKIWTSKGSLIVPHEAILTMGVHVGLI